MKLILFFLLITSTFIGAQNNYPQDYFGNPLEIPLILSGNFAELRSNHFHSGLDIKTQQRIGLKVLAAADGYVSRIKIQHYGYGKTLYITHPNGYTTVYAHLSEYSPAIEAYVKKHQYEVESYEIETFPNTGELLVKKGELVAYSGNSGGSGGPHLHFEIRDKDELPMNPMLFGIEIKDTSKPVITSLYAYPIGDSSTINKSKIKQRLKLTPLKGGDYAAESINAFGDIGFAINTFDRQDFGANSNGVYNIQTFINGSQNFEVDFKKFSFDETNRLNRFIDYQHFKTKQERVQKLFSDNNDLSMLKSIKNNGILTIQDSTSLVYKIRVSDYKNNESWITIPIKGAKPNIVQNPNKKTTPYFIYTKGTTNLKEGNVSVDIFPDTFYEDYYLDFKVKNDTLFLEEDIVPLKKTFNISYDISKYSDVDKSKLYIARLIGAKKYPVYENTKRKGDILSSSIKNLGTFALARDNVNPTIAPINFKNNQWISDFRYLKIKINDAQTGISNFRATINDKWILTEYDYKTKTLTYDFNDVVSNETKNDLKVIVTDNVGNSATFEATFYRK
ncbi:M23 family metallopeptidase [Confluentibacter flavum]|uniref:Peptidase M23 n=1 Tax=Confluentibacter flavum TaxID=1909700 RepID=A0A2N3HGM2_9FLAO|nr:M23 family metallopeptidase [Confluentibacter flavum]PKQ44117.1 peptidase M23 [Confluentibacter flavum]